MTDYTPQRTLKYKTYLKRATVEALRGVFSQHIDELLRGTKVVIDYPRKEADYPAVIVRFFEKNITNAGINHHEMIEFHNPDTGEFEGAFKFKHYFYTGDIELAISALSTYDRDLIADTLVQTITMGDLNGYTNRFFDRIYPPYEDKIPDSIWHFININSDNMMGFGETQTQTPWFSEDDLVYQGSYRIGVFGEFYSPPPDLPVSFVQKVLMYPYIGGYEDVPTGDPTDAGVWQPPGGDADDSDGWDDHSA